MNPTSPPTDYVRETSTSLAERRQLLAVQCALDRAHLRLVIASPAGAAAKPSGWVQPVLQTAIELTRFLPGKIGLWSRRFGLVASVFSRAF